MRDAIDKENKLLELFQEIEEKSQRENFDCASILGVYSEQIKPSELASFFHAYPFNDKRRDAIRVIAVCYRRAYNGGIERVQAQLAHLWVSMGYSVVLITEEKNEQDYPYPQSVKRCVIAGAGELRQRLQQLERIIKEESVDIIVNNDWVNESVAWECLLTRIYGVSYIQYVHGYFSAMFHDGRRYFFDCDKIFSMATMVLALSSDSAKFFQLCGCNTYRINNPISDELKNIKYHCPEKENHRILWVSRIEPAKRPADAIMAFSKVLELVSDATLDIVGAGKEKDIVPLKELTEQLGISRAVTFYGYQSDISSFYSKSAALLFTSEKEGYPMVLLESKAYGLPCVMYELPYLTMVEDQKGIVACPQKNVEQLTESICRLMQDDELRSELSNQARESFESLCRYDLAGTWQRIFSYCAGNAKALDNDSEFYPESAVPDDEKRIMPGLLEEMKKNAELLSKSSLDYKVGNRILVLPRKMNQWKNHLRRKEK